MRYWIRSKLLKTILYKGTTDDMDRSKKCHIYYLNHKFHPDPSLLNHAFKYGINDLDFVSEERVIEKPKKRGRLRGEGKALLRSDSIR